MEIAIGRCDHANVDVAYLVRTDTANLAALQNPEQLGLELDRKLTEKRIFPSLDFNRSGTRKEELLVDEDELNRVWVLRKVLSALSSVEAMELILERLAATESNKEFLESMASGQ